MKVFMLGWEFPPFISGGLGTACYGLTKAMNKFNTDITFVLPGPADRGHSTHVKMLTPENLSECCEGSGCCDESVIPELLALDCLLRPYEKVETCKRQTSQIHDTQYFQGHEHKLSMADLMREHYGRDIQSQVRRYAIMASILARSGEYDVVHAHDWMTYYAGVSVARIMAKPLVIHVHSTEFDRSGENVNQQIYDVERFGMHNADRVIAVSNYTRNIIINKYGVDERKVSVVHNGMDMNFSRCSIGRGFEIRKKDKVVLFMGRITMQKGPEYFLHAARMVMDTIGDVKFIMAGSGDMQRAMIEKAAELGLGPKMLFTGFLRGGDVEKAYRMSDLFVMPSVSEPFGLVPLEALANDVPVIISKQSGVSEVLRHALKVDFWDIHELANKIISVLRYPALSVTLQGNGRFEVSNITWDESAKKCIDAYKEVIAGHCQSMS